MLCSKILVIEEEWISYTNLTDGATFLLKLIKHEETIINHKIDFRCDKEQYVCTIALNSGCKTQIVQILHKECDRKFHFFGNLLSRLQNPVELSHKWVLKNFNRQEPVFLCKINGLL